MAFEQVEQLETRSLTLGRTHSNISLSVPMIALNSSQSMTSSSASASPSTMNTSHSSAPSTSPSTPTKARTAQGPGRKSFLYPEGDFRNSSTPELRDLKADMMCNWLHQQQLEKMWSTNGIDEGVMLKKAKEDYRCAPEDLRSRPDGFFAAVQRLNVKVKQ